MKRQYDKYIPEFLGKKISLITGPRQSGKITLAKSLIKNHDYLNYDSDIHRQIIHEQSWDRKKKLIIFDEIHKKKNWKQWLKGIYDVEGTNPKIIVTGSAKLDSYRKVGDSLAGRYFQYRLHPLDIREISRISPSLELSADEIIDRIMDIGGFPEPFLEGTKRFYNLWRRTHLDIILRQDLITLEKITDIRSIEVLIDLLCHKVGSPISYSSLANDLLQSDKTIKKWLEVLENLYVVFKILPFHKKISRSILKQPKYYFFDSGRVIGNRGIKLENVVACSLLKECHFRNDCLGENWDLHYLAKRGGKEIDFLLVKDEIPQIMVEVKNSDSNPSSSFSVFDKELENVSKIQIVKNLDREKTFANGIEIRKASSWLSQW